MGLCIEASSFLMSIEVTWDRNVIDQSVDGARRLRFVQAILYIGFMDSLILGTCEREVDQ